MFHGDPSSGRLGPGLPIEGIRVVQNPTDGLRLTMRRLVMVPIVYSVALLAVFIPWFSSSGFSGLGLVSVLTLLLLPWAIGVLGSVLRSANPALIWTARLITFLYFPIIFLCYYKILFVSFFAVGGKAPAASLVGIALNGLFLAWYSRCLARLSPRRCPACSRRTLIPLVRFGMQNKRTANTRWCAHCGGQFWRDRQRVWHKERRTTWLDEDRVERDRAKKRNGVGYRQEAEHVVPPHPTERSDESLVPGERPQDTSSARAGDGC
jgi:hypothetical protein